MKFLACIFALLSFGANAQEVWHKSKIFGVYPLNDGSAVIMFMTDSPQCTNASTPNKYFYLSTGVAGVNAAGFKSMYSTVLTAAAAGKEVAIAFNSGSSNCEINRLVAYF